MIKQLSVFIENKPGRLADVTGVLADAGVNMRAMSIADTTDFGILRIIVSNPEYAKNVLKDMGFTVKITDVAAVALEDKPGGLSKVLRELEGAEVSVEYMYAFTSRHTNYDAMVVFCLADPDKAYAKIKACNLKFVDAAAIEELG